jgi:hypothetical protein
MWASVRTADGKKGRLDIGIAKIGAAQLNAFY